VYGNVHGILFDGEKRPIERERGLEDSRSAWASKLFLHCPQVGIAGRFGSGRLRLFRGGVGRSSCRRAMAKPVINMLLCQFKRFLAYFPRLTAVLLSFLLLSTRDLCRTFTIESVGAELFSIEDISDNEGAWTGWLLLIKRLAATKLEMVMLLMGEIDPGIILLFSNMVIAELERRTKKEREGHLWISPLHIPCISFCGLKRKECKAVTMTVSTTMWLTGKLEARSSIVSYALKRGTS